MASIGETPLQVEGRTVTRGVAYTAVADALYLQSSWSGLAEALAQAQQGDGQGLLDGYDSYYQRYLQQFTQLATLQAQMEQTSGLFAQVSIGS